MKAVKKNKEVRKYLDVYLKRKEINNLTKKPLMVKTADMLVRKGTSR